jgi:hypothetical protein
VCAGFVADNGENACPGMFASPWASNEREHWNDPLTANGALEHWQDMFGIYFRPTCGIYFRPTLRSQFSTVADSSALAC